MSVLAKLGSEALLPSLTTIWKLMEAKKGECNQTVPDCNGTITRLNAEAFLPAYWSEQGVPVSVKKHSNDIPCVKRAVPVVVASLFMLS